MDAEGAERATGPPRVPDADSAGAGFAKNSLAVSFWTAVSRGSGFVRIAVVAAVLGPTYVGNVFQATNNLPNLAYMAFTGALFSNLLVPSLVRHVDAGDRRATERVARAFLSTALAAFAAVAAAVVLAGPLLLRLLSVGVVDQAAADSQRRIGFVLLVMFMPQLLLYAVVGTAEAVMNAHGRFALASAAPTLENVGIIATMAATAAIYGTGEALSSPANGPLYLLGIGTTSAVLLHASVQWWGACRVGVRLLPRGGWREPEVKAIIHRAVPSLGYSGLDVLQHFCAMVVANRVPGGVIAFEFAFSFYLLPSALGARPVAVSLLPRLSRLFHLRDLQRFRDELVRGATFAALLIVPAGVALVVLAQPIANAVTFGQMATSRAQALVAASLAALGPGVVGYAAFLLATYACYARQDARTPFRAALLRSGVAATGMSLAFLVPAGGIALFVLGLTVSIADLVGGVRLAARLRGVLPKRGQRLVRPLLRTLGASALMAAPAYLVAHHIPWLQTSRWSEQITLLAAVATGAGVFVLVQRWWRTPELAMLQRGLREIRDGTAGRWTS